MTEFLAILTLYYACSVAAETRPLSHAELVQCTATYNSVKHHFLPEDTGAGRHDAYLGFKRWEQDNPALVAQAEQAARRQLGLN